MCFCSYRLCELLDICHAGDEVESRTRRHRKRKISTDSQLVMLLGHCKITFFARAISPQCTLPVRRTMKHIMSNRLITNMFKAC